MIVEVSTITAATQIRHRGGRRALLCGTARPNGSWRHGRFPLDGPPAGSPRLDPGAQAVRVVRRGGRASDVFSSRGGQLAG